MAPRGRPDAEAEIDTALVEALVRDQHPDLLGPVTPVASGWDNSMFRLGPELAVRLPRRRLGAELVAREARWLPGLAALLGPLALAVPVPVREGRPGRGYPFPWTIVRWVPGETALHATTALDEGAAALLLARFLGALRSVPVPADAPRNPYRGVPLAERSALVVDRLEAIPPDIDTRAVADAWARALRAAPHEGPLVWVHGDLHPGNLVVDRGRLTGIIDWGDLCAGDPATDLSVAWMVLGPTARADLRAELVDRARAEGTDGTGLADDALWDRARGNALAHAVAVLAHSADDPAMEQMGRRTLAAALEP